MHSIPNVTGSARRSARLALPLALTGLVLGACRSTPEAGAPEPSHEWTELRVEGRVLDADGRPFDGQVLVRVTQPGTPSPGPRPGDLEERTYTTPDGQRLTTLVRLRHTDLVPGPEWRAERTISVSGGAVEHVTFDALGLDPERPLEVEVVQGPRRGIGPHAEPADVRVARVEATPAADHGTTARLAFSPATLEARADAPVGSLALPAACDTPLTAVQVGTFESPVGRATIGYGGGRELWTVPAGKRAVDLYGERAPAGSELWLLRPDGRPWAVARSDGSGSLAAERVECRALVLELGADWDEVPRVLLAAEGWEALEPTPPAGPGRGVGRSDFVTGLLEPGPDGRFAPVHLPPGTYRLGLSVPRPKGGRTWDLREVEVGDADLRLTLSPN